MRLSVLAFALLSLTLGCLPASATEKPQGLHGLSLHEDLSYKKDFTHFDYVNPNAPKGGTFKTAAIGSFDSLNPYILKGMPAAGLAITYATLMESAEDEAFSQYGLVAETVEISNDQSWILYHLRKTATFHDGTPITPEDVIFSFNTLKEKGHPFYRSYYKDVLKAEKKGQHSVKFSFSTKGNQELPLIMGQLPVLSKAYWTKNDFSKTTLSPPLGCGPYKIKDLQPGRTITYERVKNWWGENIPVGKGRYNFDEISYDYFRDATIALEAFLAGQVDFRLENIAKNWATAYDTPAVKKGEIQRIQIKNNLPAGMQGFIFNIRKDLFKDKRVREAITLAFDFEWTNKKIAFGAYNRTSSYFENSPMAAHDLPSPEEKAILEPYKDKLPKEVFTQIYAPPKTDGTGNNRANLRKAAALLEEAGWTLNKGKLENKNGDELSFQIVDNSPLFERWIQPFVQNLKRLGITASLRIVDSAQLQNIKDTFDFDMIIGTFPQSLSPGNEQRDFWTSEKADIKGSRNMIGLKSPVVDNLVEKIIQAKTKKDMILYTKSLDRVLLWGHYIIPHWHAGSYNVAFWNKFDRPKTPPKYGLGVPDSWWLKPTKN